MKSLKCLLHVYSFSVQREQYPTWATNKVMYYMYTIQSINTADYNM